MTTQAQIEEPMDLVQRLKSCAFDRDNFPNMRSERKLSVGDALDAAAEIERLRTQHEADKAGLLEYEQKVIELTATIHKMRRGIDGPQPQSSSTGYMTEEKIKNTKSIINGPSSADPNIVHPGSDHPGPFPQEEP